MIPWFLSKRLLSHYFLLSYVSFCLSLYTEMKYERPNTNQHRRTGRQYGNNPSEKDNIVPKVVRFDKLPTKTWMPRDEYIHNETVNIWSHLLGAIFMLALLMWTFFPDLYSGYHFSLADIRLVQFYLVCSAGCLLFSVRDDIPIEHWNPTLVTDHSNLPYNKSAYHCAICHSEQVAHRCLKLDYLGIILSITATNISTIYFAFYDQKVIASTYITASSVLAIGTFWAVIDPCADGPNSALWR